MSRAILSEALYNPTLYGKNKPLSRPNNWIIINVPDGKGNNKLVVLEVNENKDNIEIVHWHEADKRGLEKIKRQAEREDGQLLILPSETSEEAGALSGPTFDSPTDGKVNTFFADNQISEDAKRLSIDESADKQADGANAKLIRSKKAQSGAETQQPIEDFGEEIAGARKDMLRGVAKSIENVTIQSLIELPMSKAFKKPSLKKLLENGVISSEDAVMAEAIMQGLIYGHKKPALTRRPSSKREIASWAEETYKGIKMLGDILSGDAERRSAAMAQRRKEVDEKTREAKVHIENLRKWNPGKEFKDVESAPDAVEVIRRVLEGIGYKAGDKVALPLTRVELNQAGNGYNVSSPGKQGAYWFKRYHSTLDEAIETMVLAGKLSRGDMDAEIPQRQYSIRGMGEAHQEPTGKYVVMYFAKNGYDLKEVVFGSKEKAEVFAKERNGKVVAQQRRINEYDSYQVVVINPLTGNSHTLKDGFGTRLEASAWLEENPDEVNGMALEAIYKETGTKGEPRAHFYVTSTYSHGKMVYCVVENDRGNPWPEVKDFSSHKEAESWLKDNIGRLEAERKQRKEAERAVVYYNTSGERIGEDYRNGKDATPESFSEAFGFRGVQFGNWTNAADRQTALNQAYDALMDLAHILNVPALALSLDGELGLAFGARGGGSASAHYEPVEVVINLTKTQGAGALAHEWWHALDNYLSRRAGVTMGYASHRNGTDKMSATVKDAVENLMLKIDKSGYAKRSRDKGDYWGRGTEVMARLFESWVAWKMGKNGKLSPFLSAGINPKSLELYQALNYLAYSATEKRRAERERREPAIMSKEEFYETPESLSGYPYPTEAELAEFAPQVDALFSALSEREGESGSMAGEPRRRYRGGQMTGKSLFDWAEENERQQRREVATDEQSAAAEEANEAIDEYAAAYKEYIEATARLKKGLVEAGINEEEASAIREQMESSANMADEARERLRESLKEYYVRENTPEDAERIARDMTGRVEAEVGLRLNKEQVLRDILDKGTAEKVSAETVEAEGKHVTTGGGYISYNAVGHLPEAKVGEFAYVERQFSRTGEFLFTGNEVIRDRGDVAYIFRSLENYSVENVFAVFVKDGRGHILHIGMGGPLASYADMGAVRAGYDAFGADEIYLVHNHPSGVMKASAQDRNLMRKLEAAFDGKVKTEGIIMDTTSGRYVTFDGNNKTEVAERPREGGESAAEVMRFDGVERYGEDKELTVIRSSEDVARFVSERRLGNGDKVSYMVLSNNNEIIGNFHTNYGSLEADGLADEMASVATKFGGTSVIVYGNVGLKGASRLGAEVGRKSLTGVRLLDALEITNGLNRSALDQGLMSEGVAAYGSEVREPMVLGRGREEFDAMRERAVAERGIVIEGLNEMQVRVVDVLRHDFRGTGKQALQKAEAWAKENIAGVHTATDSRGEEFEYSISNGAIEKYVSRSATDKSANVGVHLSALKQLPEIIAESVEAEVHPDYKKGTDGNRRANSMINYESLVHRFYGAATIDGTPYCIKTTMRQYRDEKRTPVAYSYEITQIELMEAPSDGVASNSGEPLAMTPSSSMSVAKLLKGVEKSYDAGKKLLEESEKADADAENYTSKLVVDVATNGDGNKYRLVEDRETIDFLDNQPMKSGYRYSQWANHGVLPPMTAKKDGEWRAPMVFGRWEQSEEGMRKANGKADLVQGNGRTTGDVAYNPYFHIRTSPLNDQFTAAYDRPELLVIEGYYPESEETSGYRADGAKDSVGLMDWHSGSVNGQLSDDTKVQTMLSRYFKPRRIVPWSEVADLIMERVGDQQITFPINAVPPMLRAELARRGAKFGGISGSVSKEDIPMLEDLRDRVNRGEWNAGLEKAQAYQDAYDSSAEAKESRVLSLSDSLNTPVKFIRTQEEIDALPNRRQRRAKGWRSEKDNSIVIVVPNNVNVADIENTFVHEVVGHNGLRALIGAERFDEFLGEVYDHASEPIRKEIDKKTSAMVDAEADRLRVRMAQEHEQAGEDVNSHYYTDMAKARVEAEKKREQYRKEATEEYMADMAGKIGNEGFEKMDREEQTLWGKIKAKVQQFLDKFLQGLKIAKSIKLTDKDLAYILFKSWKNMRGDRGVFAQAEDVVMRYRTDWDKSMESRTAIVEETNKRFNEELQQQIDGTLPEGHVYQLGTPSEVLLSTGVPNLPIQLSAQRLKVKATEYGHNFDLGEIQNLVKELQNPMAVFVYGNKGKMQNIIVGIESNGNQFIVGLSLNPIVQGRALEINSVRNVFPKKNAEWLNWISQGKLLYADKQKIQALIDKQRTNLADVEYLDLEDVAKVVNNFENPTLDDDKIIRYRDGDDIIAKTPVLARGLYEQRVASSSYQVKEALQDSMLGLKEAYLAIEKANGRKQYIEDIAGFENAYLSENRMSSKNHAEQGAYEKLVIKPMLDEVARLAPSESKRAELTEYMMAKHGLERNALMRSNAVADGMDQKAADATDFAGLTGLFATSDVADAEDMARTCVSDYESVHNTDELWNKVNAATKATLSKLKECGLLSAATHDKIANMYDNYIPLRGWAETTADEVYGYLSRNDGNLRGSVLKKAEGRKSVADDPIATIALMGEQAIAQANRNKMKQTFFNYVRRNPSDLVSVNRLWLQHNDVTDEWEPVFASNIKDDDDAATVQQKMDAFEQKMESMAAAEPDKYKRGRQARGIPYKLGTGAVNEHTVLVKCGDDTYVMTINGNPRAAQALNGLTNPDVGTGVGAALFGLGEKINHAIAPIYTVSVRNRPTFAWCF